MRRTKKSIRIPSRISISSYKAKFKKKWQETENKKTKIIGALLLTILGTRLFKLLKIDYKARKWQAKENVFLNKDTPWLDDMPKYFTKFRDPEWQGFEKVLTPSEKKTVHDIASTHPNNPFSYDNRKKSLQASNIRTRFLMDNARLRRSNPRAASKIGKDAIAIKNASRKRRKRRKSKRRRSIKR